MNEAQKHIALQRWILLAGIVLFLAKGFAWWLTGSVAILSDALESIVNMAAGSFGLYSLWLSAQPRDEDHPYGHGKIEFISSGVEGTLISIAGIYILIRAIQRLFQPEPLFELDLGMILIALAAVIHFILGRWAVRRGEKYRSLTLVASGKHLLTDTWTTGSILAGLLIVRFTGWMWVDAVVAILLAMYILYTGYRIIRRSVAGIMDEADTTLLHEVIQTLEQHRKNEWIDLHKMRIIQYGSVLHLDCHLTVPWYFTVREAHAVVDEVERLMQHEFGTRVEMFIHLDGCKSFSCPLCTVEDCPVREHDFRQRKSWTLENVTTNQQHRL